MSLDIQLQAVAPEDFEAMLALRIEALRESLTALGRFDPAVARARLASQFTPAWMQHLCVGGERVGFFTLIPRADTLYLQHLYLKLHAQGQGIGAWVIEHLQQQARAAGLPLTLSALRGSRANAFYRRHGFVQVGESELDIDYRWEPTA